MQQRWWRRYRWVSLARFLSDQVKIRRGIKRTGSHCESAAAYWGVFGFGEKHSKPRLAFRRLKAAAFLVEFGNTSLAHPALPFRTPA
jgi:hypothetical protein